jgi:hypothetical protein
VRRRAPLPLAFAAAALGCASSSGLAPRLLAATQPGRLPQVVACWEQALEASSSRAGYLATVDFTVEGGTSRLRDARVVRLEPLDAGGEPPPPELRACLEGALDRASLPTADGPDGPGFSTARDLHVRGYRFAFVDASPERRRRAEGRAAHVLLGPRADRCQGLYAYEPPRDASALYGEVDAAKARAERARESDRDAYARELQKAYDAALELRAKLAGDLADPMLPAANKARVASARDAVETEARRLGQAVGCTPPR